MATEKKPVLGHPMHPAVVHFPITLFPLSAFFMLLWYTLGRNLFYLHAAYWAFIIGAVVIIPVLATGVRDWQHTQVDNEAGQRLLKTHMVIGSITGLLAIIGALFYWANKPMVNLDLVPGFTALTLLLTLLVFVQGFIGGLMVYTHKMGVEGHTIR